MEKVRPRCGQRSDRGRLKNRTATRVNADDDDDDEVGGCASEEAAAAGGVTGARHNSTWCVDVTNDRVCLSPLHAAWFAVHAATRRTGHRSIIWHIDCRGAYLPTNNNRRITGPTQDCAAASWNRTTLYIGWSDVTESMVTTRWPFRGYNTTQCVELNGEDLSCYSNTTESVSLRKSPCDVDLPTKRI